MKWFLISMLTVMTASAFGEMSVKRFPASTAYKVHACEKDALSRADKLLRLHHMEDPNARDIPNFHIAESVMLRAPIKAPVGKGKFDVLEVEGDIYKASYRLRFIYAQIKDTCALMGQEVMEMDSPY